MCEEIAPELKKLFNFSPVVLEYVDKQGYSFEQISEMSPPEFNDFSDVLAQVCSEVWKPAWKDRLNKSWQKISGQTNLVLKQDLVVHGFVQQPQWVADRELVFAGEQFPVIEQIIQSRFAGMNIERTMHQLGDGGQLLLLALMAAGTHSCRMPISRLISDYHTCVGNSKNATNIMVNKSLKALTFHRMALNDFDRQSYRQGLEVFHEVSKMALDMQQVSQTLETEVTLLETNAAAAWMNAEGDLQGEEEKKQELEQLKAQKEGERAAHDVDRQKFEAEQKAEEAKAREEKERRQREEEKLREMEEETWKQLQTKQQERLKLADEKEKKIQQELSNALSKVQDARTRLSRAQKRLKDSKNTSILADMGRGIGKAFSGTKYAVEDEQDNAEMEVQNMQQELDNARRLYAQLERQTGQKEADIQKEMEKMHDSEIKYLEGRDQKQNAQQVQANDAIRRITEATDKARQHHMSMIQTNADIQNALQEVGSANHKMTSVQQSAQALKICISTLAKVKATCQNSKLFWSQMTEGTKALAAMQLEVDMTAARDLERVRAVIFDSAQGWAAIGLANHRALGGMIEVLERTDAVLHDLPTGDDTLEDVQQMAAELKEKIKEETAQLHLESTVVIEELLPQQVTDEPEA